MLLVKMRFSSPLHAGSGGWGTEETEPVIHSDTLYSALVNASVELGGRADLDLLLSSAYPYVGDKLFFPRPMLRFSSALQGQDYLNERLKDLKNLRFVVEPCFRAWISGEPVDLEILFEEEASLRSSVKSRIRPRVALDRVTQASQLYFVGDVSFEQGAGLYCLIDCNSEAEPEVREIFSYLGEAGVGGERSSGYGRFFPEFTSWQPPQCPARSYVSLSLVNPSFEERKSVLAYRLLVRGGWIYSPGTRETSRRRSVGMLAEGSVFSAKVEGRIVDVTPPDWDKHRVYRYGRAFLLGAGVKA